MHSVYKSNDDDRHHNDWWWWWCMHDKVLYTVCSGKKNLKIYFSLANFVSLLCPTSSFLYFSLLADVHIQNSDFAQTNRFNNTECKFFFDFCSLLLNYLARKQFFKCNEWFCCFNLFFSIVSFCFYFEWESVAECWQKPHIYTVEKILFQCRFFREQKMYTHAHITFSE